MTPDPAIRPAVAVEDAPDPDALRGVAERSIRASYDLSPRQIEALLESRLGADAGATAEGVEATTVVAEAGDSLLGFARATIEGDTATVRWLQVDPDHRGRGLGTALFERVVAILEDRAADHRVAVLEANREGGQFLERFDYEPRGQREIVLGGETHIERFFGPDEHVDRSREGTAAAADAAGAASGVVLTAEGGLTLGEERLSGTEDPFAPLYSDAERSDPYGLYCTHCGSIDVSLDSMERARCADCGNRHRDREGYDEAYL